MHPRWIRSTAGAEHDAHFARGRRLHSPVQLCDRQDVEPGRSPGECCFYYHRANRKGGVEYCYSVKPAQSSRREHPGSGLLQFPRFCRRAKFVVECAVYCDCCEQRIWTCGKRPCSKRRTGASMDHTTENSLSLGTN